MSTVSPFSATMIGVTSTDNRHALMKQHFRAEAQQVMAYTNNVHHTTKQKAMQLQYPETTVKLSAYLGGSNASSTTSLQSAGTASLVRHNSQQNKSSTAFLDAKSNILFDFNGFLQS